MNVGGCVSAAVQQNHKRTSYDSPLLMGRPTQGPIQIVPEPISAGNAYRAGDFPEKGFSLIPSPCSAYYFTYAPRQMRNIVLNSRFPRAVSPNISLGGKLGWEIAILRISPRRAGGGVVVGALRIVGPFVGRPEVLFTNWTHFRGKCKLGQSESMRLPH